MLFLWTLLVFSLRSWGIGAGHRRGESMKFAVLLALLLTGCAEEKVACKDIDMNGVPCTVCTHQNSSGWYTGIP